MRRKLIAVLLAGAMIVPMNICSVSADEAEEAMEETMEDETAAEEAEEEAEEEASAQIVMQGFDDDGAAWVWAVDTENAVASIAGSDGEEAYYVAGPIVFGDDGTFTIMNEDDGEDYVFAYEDVSDTESVITIGETEVTMELVDDTVLNSGENYSVYAGQEGDGTLLTVGFDWDALEMAMNERNGDEEYQLSGTFEIAEDGETVTMTTEDGDEIEMTIVDADVEDQIDLTYGGETVRLALVDLDAADSEAAEDEAEAEEEEADIEYAEEETEAEEAEKE